MSDELSPPLEELARQVRQLAALPPTSGTSICLAQVGRSGAPTSERPVWLVTILEGWPYLVRVLRCQRRAWWLAASMVAPVDVADVAEAVERFDVRKLGGG